MKNFIAKIWVPALLVLVAAAQSFGIDTGRALRLQRISDSLMLTMTEDSSFAENAIDSTRLDSLMKDSLMTDSLLLDPVKVLTARDTIVAPDSLKETDPFFFKYYLAVKDSATRATVRDSLLQAGDSLELHKLDSLYIKAF